MSSKRETILEYFRTYFAGEIKTANGYNFTLGLVSRDLKNFDELNEDAYPALFVISGDEDLSGDANTMLYRLMRPIIVGYVRATDRDSSLSTETNKLIEDVINAMYKNWTTIMVGTNARLIKFTNIYTTKSLAYPFEAFELHIEITYTHELGKA